MTEGQRDPAARERPEAAKEEAPGPAAAVDEAPELHRVASSALVGGALAGLTGVAAFAAVMAAENGRGLRAAEAVVCAAVLGVAAAFLSGCADLSRRVRRRWRAPALVAGALLVMLVGAFGGGWVHGFLQGGPEAGWEAALGNLAKLSEEGGKERRMLLPCALLFLALAAPRAGLLPGGRRGVVAQALAGLVGGAGYILSAVVASDIPLRAMDLGYGASLGAALGAGLGLADRLEPRLAAAVSRRVGPEADA